MKQRTYLITLHLFDHLARSLPTSENFERQNVTSSVRRRFAQADLVRLLRFLRTFLQATRTPGNNFKPVLHRLVETGPSSRKFQLERFGDSFPAFLEFVLTFRCAQQLPKHLINKRQLSAAGKMNAKSWLPFNFFELVPPICQWYKWASVAPRILGEVPRRHS
jgi:hypothetical protein